MVISKKDEVNISYRNFTLRTGGHWSTPRLED